MHSYSQTKGDMTTARPTKRVLHINQAPEQTGQALMAGTQHIRLSALCMRSTASTQFKRHHDFTVSRMSAASSITSSCTGPHTTQTVQHSVDTVAFASCVCSNAS